MYHLRKPPCLACEMQVQIVRAKLFLTMELQRSTCVANNVVCHTLMCWSGRKKLRMLAFADVLARVAIRVMIHKKYIDFREGMTSNRALERDQLNAVSWPCS